MKEGHHYMYMCVCVYIERECHVTYKLWKLSC